MPRTSSNMTTLSEIVRKAEKRARKLEQIVVGKRTFEIIDHLRGGSQGEVHLLRRKDTGELLAMKTTKNPERSTSGRPVELRILHDIVPRHRGIIRHHCTSLHRASTRMIMEYCDGGDLSDFIYNYHRKGFSIPEAFIWHVFIHMAEALAFIHFGVGRANTTGRPWKQVLHRDVKPENMLLKWRAGVSKESNYPEVKLADFGLAACTNDANHSDIFYGGTYRWQPPERPQATDKGDVWALGGVIHAMCYGIPPIAPVHEAFAQDPSDMDLWMSLPSSRQVHEETSNYSPALRKWMLACLEFDPRKRISSSQLADMTPEAEEVLESQFEALDGLCLPHRELPPDIVR
ncbi:G2-specific serine/threonine protein kinase [Ptychographa xylographoides]|nr:G2-specific serine/threonine protein kinase [Ptychographa xylographoides]